MNLKEKYIEIINENIVHSFLDKKSIIKCMEESYKMGSEDFIEWLSKMDHLCDNINYIIEEWENQNKKENE